jgi:hypothetical protein
LAVRGPALPALVALALVAAAVAPATLASATLPSTIVAFATELALVPLFAPALTFEAFARPIAFVLAQFARRRSLVASGIGRRVGTGVANIVMIAPPVAVPLAPCAFALFGGGAFARSTGLGALRKPFMTAAPVPFVVLTPPLVGSPARPPDFDQNGLGRRCRSRFRRLACGWAFSGRYFAWSLRR